MLKLPTDTIDFGDEHEVTLHLRREDLIHPHVSGNKYRKLKYNMAEVHKRGLKTVLTFGGAYSNHIAAVAYAGKEHGVRTIGVIRGEEIESKIADNPTLRFAASCGMEFYFLSRSTYKIKDTDEFTAHLRARFGSAYIIPEGGTNELAVMGCEEILRETDFIYDFICTSVGTGGTISGLIRASKPHQQIIGFSALKGQGLTEDISKFAFSNNWELNRDFHFGGYAKINDALVAFINAFKMEYNIPLDPIYTGKMMYGIKDLIQKKYFPRGSRILAIHTGGLQGITGMNQKLKRLNKPQIYV